MKKHHVIGIACLLLLNLNNRGSAEEKTLSQIVSPDITKEIVVSNVGINRFICNGEITDVIYPQDKNLAIKSSKNNLFVKFPIKVKIVDGQEKEKSLYNEKTELYVSCESDIFSLVLVPQQISPQTIYLQSTKKEIEKANEFIKNKSHDEIAVTLISSLINNDFPKGSQINELSEMLSFNNEKFKDVDVFLYRQLKIKGFVAKEYILHSKNDITIKDTDLLLIDKVKSPFAVAILDQNFKGVTKAYVVERQNGE